MDFGKICYGEVTYLLRTSYGETGVMDFCLSELELTACDFRLCLLQFNSSSVAAAVLLLLR